MSVEAKTKFLNNVKIKFSEKFTLTELEEILNVISDEMIHYDISIINKDHHGTDDLLKVYLDALKVEGRSPKTLARYEYIIKHMLLKLNLITEEVSVFDIRNYLSSEKERGLSDRSLEGMRQIYSGYFGWLHREGLIKINPVSNIGAIKHRKKVKDIFSDIDMELLKKY